METMETIYNRSTWPVLRHTHPRGMETKADDWSHCNNRLLFYPCLRLFFLFTHFEQACGQWHWPFSEQDSRQSDLALITILSHFLGALSWRSKRWPGQPRWEMGGQHVSLSIMTHRCRITLEIKSKMLNFNQPTLMAWCEEWSLCLHSQTETEKEREGD